MKKSIIGLAMLGIMSTSAFAGEFDSVIKNIKNANNGRFQNANIEVLREVPLESLAGFYEVSIDGQPVVVNKNGVDAIIGDVFNLDKMTNISAEKRMEIMSKVAGEQISQLSEDNFVSFKAKEGVDKIGTAYVFTDTTCGYCKKLHSEIDEYAAAGVEIKYIPFPRGGIREGSTGYEEAKQIMCAKDKVTAIRDFKTGVAGNKYKQDSYDKECVELVANGLNAGNKIGLTGTPFIYLSNGTAIPGYQPASTIVKILSSK